MELRPVAEHDRDRVATAHAQLREPAGERVTRWSSSDHVSDTLSSAVRTATMSG